VPAESERLMVRFPFRLADPCKHQEDTAMAEDIIVETLLLQLLHWLALSDQEYEVVMAGWRTSCPRLQIWEEANVRGLITSEHAGSRLVVTLTDAGRALLRQNDSGLTEAREATASG
jgi:D-3-phosphoglycerate dehydrogenase